MDAIFEPYVQLGRGEGGGGGRGLGLAIVRGLAQQLGLQIAPVRTVLGRGSRFRVVIPAALRVPAAPVTAPVTPSEAALAGKMFALLDDEETPRLALASALRGAGAHCVEAAELGLLSALLAEELRFPDALLFDHDLGPAVDGVTAVQQLRRQWETEVPAVIITGRVGAIQSISLPARCSLLVKPVRLADLVGALDASGALSSIDIQTTMPDES